MSTLQSCIYLGEVGHKRVAPVQHSLRYRVYDIFVDVDELAQLAKKLKFFSYNRFNLFSISDRQFGAGDGTPIAEHVWNLVRSSVDGKGVKRIFMLCYPAVLGRTFNPLTTYYCYDANDNLCLCVFEVSNTFGQRHSYVVPLTGSEKPVHAKSFHVSPFNKIEGQYSFAVQAPGEKISLNISLRVEGKPILQAWFNGDRHGLNDWALLRSFFSFPLQPLKVVAGIHWEALKLWLKGLPLVARPSQTASKSSFPPTQKNAHPENNL